MITVSVEDAVFVGAAVVGVALLLASFVFDAQLRRAPGALRVVVGFVSMFGVGGLIATRLLDVHGGGAAAAGVVAALIGAVLGSALFGLGRTSESRGPVSMRDLVGGPASVAVSIPAGRFGSVYVKAEGRYSRYNNHTHTLTWTDTWLWDKGGHFQLDTLSEGQLSQLQDPR